MKSRLGRLMAFAVTGFGLIGCLPADTHKPRLCEPGSATRGRAIDCGPRVYTPATPRPQVAVTRTTPVTTTAPVTVPRTTRPINDRSRFNY
ncbi:MAG: hypothetical protein ACU0CR_15175 [Sagittula sp.]|jgi:hypothetical protein|uniref:hypothetical protein n=2 Tax=Sagittula TaxID=58842 RepID=UPI000C2CEDA3|nr:hypothetical protein CDO87_21450 [Sagittula sp. P11]